MIFQDPISSLNPRRKVGDIVAEGLDIWEIGDKASRREKVDTMLATVGLDPETARGRRPHEFSGGQCQRISIARAIITEPKLIICDEPVSALDVSVQAQILNLLEDMKARYQLTMVFIAHDLAVVKNVSDRVAVMYLGKFCEVGPPDDLYARPAHPYTAALLAAIPEPDPHPATRPPAPSPPSVLGGEIPSPTDPPSGCRFRTRCPRAQERCAEEEPQLREVADSPADRRAVRGLPLPARGRRADRVPRRGLSSCYSLISLICSCGVALVKLGMSAAVSGAPAIDVKKSSTESNVRKPMQWYGAGWSPPTPSSTATPLSASPTSRCTSGMWVAR